DHGPDVAVAGGRLERQGVEARHGDHRDPEGGAEALGGGHAHPDAGIEAGADVHGDPVQVLRRPAHLVEAEVDGGHHETGVTGPVDQRGGSDHPPPLGEGHRRARRGGFDGEYLHATTRLRSRRHHSPLGSNRRVRAPSSPTSNSTTRTSGGRAALTASPHSMTSTPSAARSKTSRSSNSWMEPSR